MSESDKKFEYFWRMFEFLELSDSSSSGGSARSSGSSSGEVIPEYVFEQFQLIINRYPSLPNEDIDNVYQNNPSYLYIERIGEGSFGEVFKACHSPDIIRNSRQEFAIKIVRTTPDTQMIWDIESMQINYFSISVILILI